MPQFLDHRFRDQDFAEERSKDFRTVNDDQIIQWSGVSHDHAKCIHASTSALNAWVLRSSSFQVGC